MKILTHSIPFTEGADWLLELFKDEDRLFFLDSSIEGSADGQFSYLGFAPFKTVRAKNFAGLRKVLQGYLNVKSALPFPCGAVGYLSYEGDLCFGLYDSIIRVDHSRQELTMTASGLPHKTPASQEKAARQKIDYILYKIQQTEPRKSLPVVKQKMTITSSMSAVQYKSAVKRALKHIHDGDIYQISLAHRFSTEVKGLKKQAAAVEIYKNLRRLSPSSFSSYLDDGEKVILSSSPERFLQLTKRRVQVKPMKGTRPRGTSSVLDNKNRRELEDSVKEKAELLMVTDLERNDLGRVCSYGSVSVKAMRTIEEYATVFQATSTIEGDLRKDCDQFDLLESAFPSGSVTGCPKIEAMKIIRKLESKSRGLYTGALGYISFTGDMDFSVLIRTLFVEGDEISFYVGSGIVADSNPVHEYEETIIKSKAMVDALRKSF